MAPPEKREPSEQRPAAVSRGWAAGVAALSLALAGGGAARAQGFGSPDLSGVLPPTPNAGTNGPAGGVGGGVGGAAGGGIGGGVLEPGPGATTPNDQGGFQHRVFPQAGGAGPPAGAAGQPAWQVTPRISLSESYNDNIYQSQVGRKSDFITYVTPGVNVQGNTQNVQVSLDYAPTAGIYAEHGKQDFIGQNLNGIGNVTVVPDFFFINTRAYGSLQPTLGGIPAGATGGFTNTTSPSFNTNGSGAGTFGQGKQSLTQTLGFSVTPYLVQRFGDYGTGKIGYSYQVANSSGQNQNQTPLFQNGVRLATNNQLANGTTTTNSETAQFLTGEYFGRFKDLALLNGNQNGGTGATSNASQYFATNTLGYAVTRVVTVFGELGYEDISYSTTPRYKVNGETWAAGTTITPDPDSTLTIGYEYKYGFGSIFGSMNYQVTPHAVIAAQYYTGLGTELQQIQTTIANTTVDPFGNSVTYDTGAPIFTTNTAGLINGNSSVYRSRNLNLTGFAGYDRDTFQLSLIYSTQTTVGVANTVGSNRLTTSGLGSGNIDSISGSLGWSHSLSDSTATSATVGYGHQTLGPQAIAVNQFSQGSEDFLSVSAGVSHQLTETLSVGAQYTYYNRSSNIVGRSYYQNVFLVGLTKSF